jgi:uncharacterized protein (DUF1697 family)
MTSYAALLRGVNVGGVNLKMAELAEVFRGLGLDDVKTVLASGNVLFSSPRAASTLKPAIEEALRAHFGYDAWVHVLETRQIAAIVDAFPFEEREGWHAYVIFTVHSEPRDALLALELDPARESVAAGDGVVYWTVERGDTLTSVVGKGSGKARYKPWITTRNLRTLRKLT